MGRSEVNSWWSVVDGVTAVSDFVSEVFPATEEERGWGREGRGREREGGL